MKKPQSQAPLSPKRLALVQAWIEAHFADDVSVAELAAKVHLSPFHFARAFRKSLGQPPHRYLVARRLDRSKELLAESDLTILQVAKAVGYRTQAHFAGTFRNYVGETPAVYRGRHRGDSATITPGPNLTGQTAVERVPQVRTEAAQPVG